jgi:iron complex transport system substrate-binding protein
MLWVNRLLALLVGLTVHGAVSDAHEAPRVVSINLCADQLLLNLASPGQILSLSWLASDPQESMLAAEARRYPVNYGTAEEVLAFDPDIILAGNYTGLFTRRLLQRLGYTVHEIAPANGLADIERNIRLVARAIEREQRAEALITEFRARQRTLAARTDDLRVAFVRPGGFTIDRHSLAHELIELAGIRNVASEGGLDRWGSLPLEALVRTVPDAIAISRYEADAPALANSFLEHPALRVAAASTHAVHVPIRYWACGLPQSLDTVELLLTELAAAGAHAGERAIGIAQPAPR